MAKAMTLPPRLQGSLEHTAYMPLERKVECSERPGCSRGASKLTRCATELDSHSQT